jgi:hypothetical protein
MCHHKFFLIFLFLNFFSIILIFYSLLQNSRRVDLGNCLAKKEKKRKEKKRKLPFKKLVAHPHVTLRDEKFTYQVDNRRKVVKFFNSV